MLLLLQAMGPGQHIPRRTPLLLRVTLFVRCGAAAGWRNSLDLRVPKMQQP